MAISLQLYLFGALALSLLYTVVRPFVSPLRSIPGPFVARFTNLWFLYRTWRGRFDKDNMDLHQRYGNVVRYGPYHYCFNDPDAIRIIYGKGTEFDKSSWYEAWNAPGFKTLFTEPSIKAHGQLRRKFQNTYSMSSLVNYEGYADHCIGLLKQRLEETAKGESLTDMAHWMLCYAGDTVAMITYSKRLGFLDAGKDVGGFFKNLHGNLKHNTLMGIYAALHPVVFHTTTWLSQWNIVKASPRMSIGRFTSRTIAERRKERELDDKSTSTTQEVDENAPRDFLGKFLDSNEEDSTRFTEHDINVGLIGNVVAGSDTTAAALSATLYCLLKHPIVLSKLRNEIHSRVQAGQYSSPPTFKEVHEMPYLQATIQEAMRLYPACGLPLQRVVPQGGAEICGHYFPAGTVVGVSSKVTHFNTSIFGEDAAVFRPERWIESDKETLSYMNRHWMPFGLGSRTCIGKNISMLEMTKLIPELLRCFDFDLADELKNDDKEWEWEDYWLMRPYSLPVSVSIRDDI